MVPVADCVGISLGKSPTAYSRSGVPRPVWPQDIETRVRTMGLEICSKEVFEVSIVYDWVSSMRWGPCDSLVL